MISILVVVLFLFFLFCFERRRRNVAKKNCIYGELRHERVLLGSLDLVHDTLHLCTRFGDGGIKAMSRVISGEIKNSLWGWWDKSNVTCYFRGQTSDKIYLFFYVLLNLAAVPNV